MAVIFNWGSADPKGSTSICQGFCNRPVKMTYIACEITPDSVVELLRIFLFVLIRFYAPFLHRLTVLNHFCC